MEFLDLEAVRTKVPDFQPRSGQKATLDHGEIMGVGYPPDTTPLRADLNITLSEADAERLAKLRPTTIEKLRGNTVGTRWREADILSFYLLSNNSQT